MMRRARAAALGLALLAGLAATPARAQTAPEVSIASVDSLAIQGQAAVLDLTLSIRNPNGMALPLQALRFHCWLNGVDVSQGRSTSPVTIPAGGQAQVPVRLDVDSPSMLGVLASLPPDGTLRYRLDGSAEIGLTLLQVPFSHSGTVQLNLR